MQTACSENINQLSNMLIIDTGLFGIWLINKASTDGPISLETRSSHSMPFNSRQHQLSLKTV